MICLLALALGTAAGISVDAEEGQQCPSAEQVTAAFAAHRVLASANALSLRVEGRAGAPTIHLLNNSGKEILTRELHSPAASDDCFALADSVALIVERYLDEIEMKRLETATSSTSSTPVVVVSGAQGVHVWAVGLRLLGRSGRENLVVPGAEAWAERRVDVKETPWTIAAAAGGLIPNSLKTQRESASVDLLETWIVGRGGPWLKLGSGFLGLQLEAGVAAIRGRRSPDNGSTQSDWGVAPWLGMSARYRHELAKNLFAEAAVGGDVSLVRHELVVEVLPDETHSVVAKTPRLFAEFSLSLGLRF